MSIEVNWVKISNSLIHIVSSYSSATENKLNSHQRTFSNCKEVQSEISKEQYGLYEDIYATY